MVEVSAILIIIFEAYRADESYWFEENIENVTKVHAGQYICMRNFQPESQSLHTFQI